MSETGWGEFEVAIKIQFQDPAEKPVTLFHHLRLYQSNETILRDKSIVCEKYDEIVRPFLALYRTRGSHTLGL